MPTLPITVQKLALIIDKNIQIRYFATPKWLKMATKASEDFKFRISCKMMTSAAEGPSEFEFRYVTFREARENYKAILLGLYRKKDLDGFTICLNRCRDTRWRHAIYKEKA